MNGDEQEDTRPYFVVMNHEEQYSIWLAHLPVPEGWTTVGEARSKEGCLAYIEQVWTDMRPLSLRLEMAATAPATPDHGPTPAAT